MNKLNAYLTGKSHRQFAQMIGISPPYLSQILNDKKRPSFDLMVKIMRATENAVVLNDWIID